ncbi:hypothetical protein IB279_00815 [Ensifer sp. ENS06]|nr:hypothetical protein [Ensifer sp. ENS06]
MLDAVDRSLSRLRGANLYTKRMPISFITDGVSVIYDLDSAGVLGSIGISNTIANKLKNLDGTLQANVMIASLDRVKSYLRRIESEFGGADHKSEEDDRIFELDTIMDRHPPEPVPVWAEQWVYVRPQSRAKAIIAEISELLDEVALLVKSSNLPEEQAALTDLDRAQLIALLETALLMLRAPLVEPGLLKKLQKAATDGASKTVQKGAEQAMGDGLRLLGNRLLDLIQWLVG